ncbi:MAG: hypothetical protein LM580_10810, partial [Thermofilum sp.]|nr:hypothetical protein [Thermofilum sp.]
MTLLSKVKLLGFSSGAPLVVVDERVAEALGVRAHDRLLLRFGGREAVAVVNVARNLSADAILVNEEVAQALGVRDGDAVEVSAAPPPRSARYIRDLLRG